MSLKTADAAYSFLGLVQKSGLISSGDDTVERDIKKGNCYLLIVAEDSSVNTRKRFENMAEGYGIRCIKFGTKEKLGHSIGKSERAVICIKDRNLARGLLSKLNNQIGGESIDSEG